MRLIQVEDGVLVCNSGLTGVIIKTTTHTHTTIHIITVKHHAFTPVCKPQLQ